MPLSGSVLYRLSICSNRVLSFGYARFYVKEAMFFFPSALYVQVRTLLTIDSLSIAKLPHKKQAESLDCVSQRQNWVVFDLCLEQTYIHTGTSYTWNRSTLPVILLNSSKEASVRLQIVVALHKQHSCQHIFSLSAHMCKSFILYSQWHDMSYKFWEKFS